MDNQSPVEDLFIKYLENRCTADEIRLLMNYFEVDQNEEMLGSMIHASLTFELPLGDQPLVNAAVKEVREILINEIRKDLPEKKARLHQLYKYMRIAAITLLLIGSAFALNHYNQNIRNYFDPVKMQGPDGS